MVRSTCSRTTSTILRSAFQERANCRWQPKCQRQSLHTETPAERSITSRSTPPQLSRLPRLQQQHLRKPITPTSRRRAFSTSTPWQHGDLTPPKPGEERRVTFIDKELQEHTFEVADGDNLLDIAQANDLEMEGACGGSCACSTCHVIVRDDEMYDSMEEPSDDENDMLDLAFGLTETSRLGCQVIMSKELDGLVVKLPSMTRNLQASDFADKENKS
ncbi:Adrenodoxin mitochondrial [Lecanosticta acicola]|uniref:Adrenodoxin mitochondrial n=1 Tax=Lecanosticta acicola TaxID=111012 RepID=A0AAI8YZ27_9PEZI|nr:Adrenodoxin mitochondrial [Lecanosticta acicola]